MAEKINESDKEFDFLPENALYFDSACQSLRPVSVQRAMEKYYREYNSCGERVRYEWGAEVDRAVTEARRKTLKFLGLPEKKYFVAFTLNTTYGINLLLSQLRVGEFDRVFTSDIEHNSPFLSTIAFAKKHKIPREILVRDDDGSIATDHDFSRSLVVVSAASNIDARRLQNLAEFAKKVKKDGGTLVIDAAQATAFYSEWLRGELKSAKVDAVCFSGHKMYGPSMGVIAASRKLVEKLDTSFIGGGMVDDVREDSYDLSALTNPSEHIHTILEPGLQLYAEIIGYSAAIDYVESRTKADYARVEHVAQTLFDFLKSRDGVHVTNQNPTSTISFYSDKIDAHLLADALSDEGVMTRSGYFCCHYYLDHQKHFPPLVRLSMSFANRARDGDKLVKILEKAL